MHQLNILNKMHINLQNAEDLQSVGEASLIIDEIIGYSLKGEPHGYAADMIIWANKKDVPVRSLDIPSGLNPTHGKVSEPVIYIDTTTPFAPPKTGLAGKMQKDLLVNYSLLIAESLLNFIQDYQYKHQTIFLKRTILSSSVSIPKKFRRGNLLHLQEYCFFYILLYRIMYLKGQLKTNSKQHRLKRSQLIKAILFIFSEEYENSDLDTIWEIKLPVEKLRSRLKEKYEADYTSNSWISHQIRNYEKKIGSKLFLIQKSGNGTEKTLISLYRLMNAFDQNSHVYITYKIKIANGAYALVQNYIKVNKIDRPLNILLGSGNNPYFFSNIIAEKCWKKNDKYNIYTHNIGIIKKLCSSHVNSEKIKLYSPAGRIDQKKNTIMGSDNELYLSTTFDFIIQSTHCLYNGTLYVDTEEESIRKQIILKKCRGTKVLMLVMDELTDEPAVNMASFGSIEDYNYIVIPRTRSNRIKKHTIKFSQYENILEPEIINWNYCIYRVKD